MARQAGVEVAALSSEVSLNFADLVTQDNVTCEAIGNAYNRFIVSDYIEKLVSTRYTLGAKFKVVKYLKYLQRKKRSFTNGHRRFIRED